MAAEFVPSSGVQGGALSRVYKEGNVDFSDSTDQGPTGSLHITCKTTRGGRDETEVQKSLDQRRPTFEELS